MRVRSVGHARDLLICLYYKRNERTTLFSLSAQAWHPSTYYERAHNSIVPLSNAAVPSLRSCGR